MTPLMRQYLETLHDRESKRIAFQIRTFEDEIERFSAGGPASELADAKGRVAACRKELKFWKRKEKKHHGR